MNVVDLTPPRISRGAAKFDEEFVRAAWDLLDQNGNPSDGEVYSTEGKARTAGNRLRVEMGDYAENKQEPAVRVRVWEHEGGHVFSLVPKQTGPGAGEESNADALKRSYSKTELGELAETHGLDSSGTKAELAARLDAAGVPADTTPAETPADDTPAE